jgi:pyruvate dehydrogenase E1 component
MVRPYVPRRYRVLGTDGFGRSDYRVALRRFFEVDRHHLVLAAIERDDIDTEAGSPWRR